MMSPTAPSRFWPRLRLCALLVGLLTNLHATASLLPTSPRSNGQRVSESALRPHVNPRRNVEEFKPVTVRFVRMLIFETNRGEPCLDEFEIWTDELPSRNVALASFGTKVTVSGSLEGYQIHRVEHINDGLHGNGRSWISSEQGRGWVQFELPQPMRIGRVIWGRDREGQFIDRLITRYRIEVALNEDDWTEVASSDDRMPLELGSEFSGLNPATLLALNRFRPVSASIDGGPAPVPPPQSGAYMMRTWQIEQGLPNNTVTSILQAQTGYLWVGTLNGLTRFDGVRFVTYGDAEGLPNPAITCLFEDRDGVLWVGTEDGLVALINGRFQTPGSPFLPPFNSVFDITQDANGRIWAGSMNGLFYYENGRWTDAHEIPGLPRQAILSLAPGPQGSLFYQAMESTLLTLENDQVRHPPFEGEPASFSSLYTLAPGNNGSIWVGGANAYAARLGIDGQITVLDLSQTLVTDPIWEIHEAHNGDVWIGTASGGLVRWRQGQFLSLTTQDGLSHNSIRSLCEDREGNLWVGTNGGGLMRLRERRLSSEGTREGLSHEVILSMVQDDAGRVWIGTNCGGLNVWDDDGFRPYSLGYLVDNECIWSLAVGPDATLWIGTWANGLIRLQDGKIVRLTVADGLPDDTVLALHLDSKKRLWIGTRHGGLGRYHEGRFERFRETTDLSARTVTSILEQTDGALWVGTAGEGLARVQNEEVTHFSRDEGLGSRFVRCLFEDSQGVLWVGTSDGLSFLTRHRRFRTLTGSDGLVDALISQIQEDADGNLWIGSNRGIYRLSRTELNGWLNGGSPRLTPLSLDRGDGLASLECTGGYHPAGLQTVDGHLWFATVQGIVRIDPNQLVLDQRPAPIHIESVLVDGLPNPPVPGTASAELGAAAAVNDAASRPGPTVQHRVPHKAQRLEIQFTALSLSAPERVQFRYRMLGLDPDWIQAGTRRSAVYTHLPPGRYPFEVRATNHDGFWNETGARLLLIIPTPFYQTGWFLTASSLLLLGGAAAIVRHISVRSIRNRLLGLEQEHALERERARIAQDIHDDLGAGLTQIGWLSEFGEQKREVPHQAARYFQQIGQTAREIVQSMDAIVWALNPGNDSLESLASYLSRYSADFLGVCGMRCRMDVPENVPALPLSAESRHNVFLVVKEALNNAAKHSQAREVRMRFSVATDRLILVIEDDGVGPPESLIDGSTAPWGNGLRNMRQRMQSLGGSFHLSFASETKKGTRIECRLPLAT